MNNELEALQQLEAVVSGLLSDLSSSGRTQLMRKVAKDWRKSQADRIRRQQNPDGSAFEKRKRRVPSMGQYAVRFLYPEHGSGEPRVVRMKSWRRDGHLLTGWDIERGEERSFQWSKVIRWLSVAPEDQNKGAGKLNRRVTLRQQAMFKKLRTNRFMRAGANEREAWVGFVGGVAEIARIHQEGRKAPVARGAPDVKYPMRELLGMTLNDREDLLDLVIQHLEG